MSQNRYNKENQPLKSIYADKIAKLAANESICETYSLGTDRKLEVDYVCNRVASDRKKHNLFCTSNELCGSCIEVPPYNLGCDYELDVNFIPDRQEILLKRKRITVGDDTKSEVTNSPEKPFSQYVTGRGQPDQLRNSSKDLPELKISRTKASKNPDDAISKNDIIRVDKGADKQYNCLCVGKLFKVLKKIFFKG